MSVEPIQPADATKEAVAESRSEESASPTEASTAPQADEGDANAVATGSQDELVPRRSIAELPIKIGSLRDHDSPPRAKSMDSESKAEPKTSSEQLLRMREARSEDEGDEPRTKYPPPNLRNQLPPDLEKQVDEAIGDVSIESLLEGDGQDQPSDLIEAETRVTGRIVSMHREDVFVDLGVRNQGILPLKQFEAPPEAGAEITVIVRAFDNAEGLYQLMLPGAALKVGDWSQVTEGIVVEALVTGHNKGGLDCEVGGLRGFMPISQIATYRVEDLEQFTGERFQCVVTEANPKRRNLVLSHRAVLEREQAEAKKKLWEELAVGQTRDGVVRNLQPFGAFVDLGGVDGLIHISQVSWDRVDHSREVFEVGQKVQVRVEKIDRDSGRVGLAYRDLIDNPWDNVGTKYPEKAQVTGTVSKLADFGAFVKLEPGVEGLVHVSELSHKRIWRPSDILKEGQQVEAMVLSVDPGAQRIGLSLKALEAKPAEVGKREQKEKEDESAQAELEKTRISQRKRAQSLKGGVDRPSGGEQFGLKW